MVSGAGLGVVFFLLSVQLQVSAGWSPLAAGAARLAFYVFDVDAVQVAADREPGGAFAAWAPGGWWWPRAEL